MGKVSLSDIVSMPAFEEAGSLFHQATGMIISFRNETGETVFYPAEARCELCRLIQSTTEGMRRCSESDERAAREALQTGRPMPYTCHAGLTDVVVPVVVGGKKIGCFYSGQSLLKPPTPMGYQEIRARVDDLGLDPNQLWEAYSAAPTVERSRLELALGLLSIICNHLVEGEMALRQERALTLEQRKLRKAAEEKARLERDLREMELRLLQAQLNPHFLFNALNLILGQAMAEKAPLTSNLVTELSVLLRSSLANIGSFVSLSDEVDSARAYVDIFKSRFGKQIEMRIDLPEELRSTKVPALMLQPLVENALVHALPLCQNSFRISISATAMDGSVEVTVADNGPNLSNKTLRDIRSSISTTDPVGKLTGLTGLNRRMRCYYKSTHFLQIDSIQPGLAVTVCIPS